MRWIGLGFAVSLLATHASAGTIRGTVSSIPAIEWGAADGHFWHFVDRRGVAEPVLLILDGVNSKAVKAKLPPPTLTIEGFSINPPLLPIRAGATLTLHNLDRHSYSCFGEGQAEEFALNDLKGGGEMEKKLPAAPRFVLRCHAFPFMRAELVVVPSPVTTFADRNGDFTFSDIPPGDYTLMVYAAGAFRGTKAVKVEALGVLEVSLALQMAVQVPVPVAEEPPAKAPAPAAAPPAKAPAPLANPPSAKPPLGEKKRPKKPKKNLNEQEIEIEIE